MYDSSFSKSHAASLSMFYFTRIMKPVSLSLGAPKISNAGECAFMPVVLSGKAASG
jgi:hypothetical protein